MRDAWIQINKEACELIQEYMSDAADRHIGSNFSDARDLWLKYKDFYDLEAIGTARMAEVSKNARTLMKESDSFVNYYAWVMPYITEHYNCQPDAVQARDQLLHNCTGVKRLTDQVKHCRLSNCSILDCKNLLGVADVRAPFPPASKGGAFVGMMENGSDAVFSDEMFALRCDELHKGDCTRPCKYCSAQGERGKEVAKNHELMDCIKYRIYLGKQKIVPNYLNPNKREDAESSNNGSNKRQRSTRKRGGNEKKDEQKDESS